MRARRSWCSLIRAVPCCRHVGVPTDRSGAVHYAEGEAWDSLDRADGKSWYCERSTSRLTMTRAQDELLGVAAERGVTTAQIREVQQRIPVFPEVVTAITTLGKRPGAGLYLAGRGLCCCPMTVCSFDGGRRGHANCERLQHVLHRRCAGGMLLIPRVIRWFVRASTTGCVVLRRGSSLGTRAAWRAAGRPTDPFPTPCCFVSHLHRDMFSEVVTNPAHVEQEGDRLRVSPHQPASEPHGCPICSENLCKGDAAAFVHCRW